MKLNSVIIADVLTSCNIAGLFEMLKATTMSLLDEYKKSHADLCLYNNEISSDGVTKMNLSEYLSTVNEDKFLCYWYGHGKDDALLIDNEELVTTTDNYYLFSNALIYTFSCLNGKKLADVLIENKAVTFVGYTAPANCPYGLDETTCDIVTSFINSFLAGKTVNDSLTDLKEAYGRAINDNSIEPFVRACFLENRDSLVVKGNGDITINDMFVTT